MTRLLTILAGLFAILVLIERYAVEREAAREALYGTLRPLAPVAPEIMPGRPPMSAVISPTMKAA